MNLNHDIIYYSRDLRSSHEVHIPQVNWSSVSVFRAMPLSEAGALHVPALKTSGGVSIRNCGNQRNSQSHRNGLLVKSLQNIIEYLNTHSSIIFNWYFYYCRSTYRVSIAPRPENVPSGILLITLPCKFLHYIIIVSIKGT